MSHWHAVNDSLSPDDAALCVYPTRVRARNMLNIWLRGAEAYHWKAEPVGSTGWRIYSGPNSTSVNVIDVKQCDKAECAVQP